MLDLNNSQYFNSLPQSVREHVKQRNINFDDENDLNEYVSRAEFQKNLFF